MKKIFALLLTLVMLLGLVACNTSSEPQNTEPAPVPSRVLKVGFGKGDITPTEPVAADGGMSTQIVSTLEIRTMAFQDENDNLFIHLVTDLSWGGMSDDGPVNSLGVCDMARNVLQKEMGIDPAYVTVAGTHNHSQVVYSAMDEATTRWRENILLPQIVASVQQAIEDLAPAEMYIGRTETQNLTFVRRYWLKDGTFYDGYTSNRDTEIDRHESEADEEIQLVKFTREGKKDILIVNWQSHATAMGNGGTIINPDFVGPLREKVEEDTGVLCIFSQGACGNLAPNSRIASENTVNASGWAKAQRIGKAVAAYVVDVVEREDFTKVNTGLIQMKRVQVAGTSNKTDPAMVENAKKVVEFSKTATNNYETAAYAAQFGIETIYHAKTIISNVDMPDTKYYEVNIITIGDVAFTTLPMEFFDTTGMQIKDGSPFEMTILLGYSCGKGQYVADIEAWEHGGYESYKTYFAKGTAEQAVGYYLEALNEFYPTRLG